MKYRTEVVREGELLGPIDWGYDFLYHFQNWCATDAKRLEYCEKTKERLRQVEADPSAYQVMVSHSWVWHTVYAVGMYDGWPFWKPTPALLLSGPIGSEWHFFYDLTQVAPIAREGVA